MVAGAVEHGALATVVNAGAAAPHSAEAAYRLFVTGLLKLVNAYPEFEGRNPADYMGN